ncbi:MAG: hypothetical protein IPQ24_12730 [Anaeromyxobacter sp.]|nr:hypothetical protein [Anaeromyxobacter sp.]
MRRMLLPSIIAIALVFLGSLALLDWLGGSEAGDPQTPVASPPPAPSVEAPPPAPTATPAEVAAEMRAPPSLPAPAPPPEALPPSGAPPAPGYVRDETTGLQATLSSRCGAMELRLGDDLRRRGDEPEGRAVLLVEVEPQQGQLKFWSSKLQSPGQTRPSLVACVQWALNGYVLPVSRLQPGERFKVQVVIGVRAR